MNDSTDITGTADTALPSGWHTVPIRQSPCVFLGRRDSPSPTTDPTAPVPLYWTASGFELDARGSELWLDIEAAYDVYEPWIVVELDGVPVRRSPLARGRQRLELFRGHGPDDVTHVRVLKETQAMHDDPGSAFLLHALVFPDGVRLAAPVRHHACFEFVGDSITSGTGAIGSGAQKSYCSWIFSAENGFPRMVADHFSADFRVISQAGWGVVCNCVNDPTCTIPSVYTQVCAFGTPETAARTDPRDDYDFTAEPADVVVINLGTNDASAFHAAPWQAHSDSDGRPCGEMGVSPVRDFALRLGPDGLPDRRSADLVRRGVIDFLTLVRGRNPKAFLLWCYGMMGDGLASLIRGAVDEYRRGTGDTNVDFLLLPSCTGEGIGAFAHPSSIGHAQAAHALIRRLAPILGEPSEQEK